MGSLDERSRSVLDLERRWAIDGGRKAGLIRRSLGMSLTRYHQVLVRVIDLPEALAYDPMLVRRLRRLRAARRRARRPRAGIPRRHAPTGHG